MYIVKRSSPQWIALALYVLGGGVLSFATSIVIVRRQQQLTIATDGLGLSRDNGGNIVRFNHCKIQFVNDVYFVFAGFRDDVDTGFHPDQSVVRVLNGPGTIESRTRRISEQLKQSMLRAVQRVFREASPAQKKQLIGDGTKTYTILELLVFGIENGAPTVVSIDFNRIDNTKHQPIGIKPVIGVCPGTACPEETHFWVMGEKDAIDQALKGSFIPVWTGSDADDVRKLVNLEVSADPQDVGGPIDVLVIDKTGRRWISPLGNCGTGTSDTGPGHEYHAH